MLKKLPLLCIALALFCNNVLASWTNKTMQFGGLTRSYRVYVSPNYSSASPASLLIALHGLGDNMTNFSAIGFNYIADTANIICVFPQAATDALAGTAWNSGAGALGYYPNSSVNDVGFINALMDTSIANYAIDQSKIYVCGFSMGGFMTQKMALQSNTRIAAFASMSGTIGSGITNKNPGRHVPIAHFHGTADNTVSYSGNQSGMDVDSLIKFWVNNNGCTNYANPVTYNYPNTANDTITITRYQYGNGSLDSDVWFYKMTGASHTVLFQPNNDMTEPIEVWLFFRRYKLSVGIEEYQNALNQIKMFPNPATNIINLSEIPVNSGFTTTLKIYTINGQLAKQQVLSIDKSSINLDELNKGIYFVEISNTQCSRRQKIVVE